MNEHWQLWLLAWAAAALLLGALYLVQRRTRDATAVDARARRSRAGRAAKRAALRVARRTLPARLGPGLSTAAACGSPGNTPSDDLLLHVQRDLALQDHWRVSGEHYARTAEAWLERLDGNREQALAILAAAYGPARAGAWLANWRVFFLACAELWGYRRGREWLVSHYLFAPRPTSA